MKNISHLKAQDRFPNSNMPKSEREKHPREIFVREFVKHILLNTQVKRELPKNSSNVVLENLAPSPFKIQVSNAVAPKDPVAVSSPAPNKPLKMQPMMQPRPIVAGQRNFRQVGNPLLPKKGPMLQEVNQPRVQAPIMPSPVTPPRATNQVFEMGKIDTLLADPLVSSLECPGPEKPVILTRGGFPQTTALILKTEEINEIMNIISKNSKIPLLSGVFKAALGNLLVTALISDYIGTRFVIQKLPAQKA